MTYGKQEGYYKQGQHLYIEIGSIVYWTEPQVVSTNTEANIDADKAKKQKKLT